MTSQRDALGDALRSALTGRYTIERELGRGGMATVFLARDTRHARAVALKVLERDVVTPVGAQRFLHEIQIAAGLTHPHVLPVHDSGEANGLLYYVMPYVEGETLRARLTREGLLPLADAVRLLRELADALAYAHGQGVVHRDLKPENVLLSGGHAIIADFGIAKALRAATHADASPSGALTSAGVALGTPAYMAPEQAVGDIATDYRADLYALGVIGYELIAGAHPFGSRSPQALLMALLTEVPAPLGERRQHIPPALSALIMQLLAKDPADRPANADAVLRVLDGLASASDIRHVASATTVDPPRTAHRWMTLGALAAIVALAGIAAYAKQKGMPVSSSAFVAVVPFANTTGDLANETFADGITDELIGTLSKVSGLRVLGRTSSFALKGKSISPRAIADTLGVSAVLEGSFRRDGNRLKVTAQLLTASDGAVIWTETYDRELADVFRVEEDIARAIAAALRVKLVARQPDGSPKRPTADAVAYESYLRGRLIMRQRSTREGALDAIRQFEQAIARDSLYARAYAGLSDAYTRLGSFGFERPDEAYKKADAYAQRALVLDSTLADAHASRGHVLFVRDFDWAEAEREFHIALSLDPSYEYARISLALCLAMQGRFPPAIAQLDSARATDPLTTTVGQVLGRIYVYQRKSDLAIDTLRRVLELNPQLALSQEQLGHAYLQKRMYSKGIDALRQAAALGGIRDSAQLAYAYAVASQPAEARRILHTLLESSRERHIPPFHIAMAYAGLGQVDDAFRWLSLGYDQRSSFMNAINVETAFESLHGDPRWAPLIRRMGLRPGPASPR